MPIHVTDIQLAALRACLDGAQSTADPVGQIDRRELRGLGYLSYAAFVIAVRRRFGSPWTNADIVRYVANVRSHAPDGDDIDPLAAENLIRQALGGSSRSVNDDPSVQAILLSCLAADEGALGRVGIDDLMASARKLADEWLDQANTTT
jgi:hypothetical protein